MNYEQVGNDVILHNTNSFNICEILECGQCFRFFKLDALDYVIVAFSKVLRITQQGNTVKFHNTTTQDFENIWFDYFDLQRNYEEIKQRLCQDDEVMQKAVNFAGGIRILNQEIWECLISFIISQNNRIPMIKKAVNNLSVSYGNKICDEYYSFPTIEQLLNKEPEQLKLCKTGFRAKYICDAVNKISNGEIKLNEFSKKQTPEIKTELMSINGVGPKVSDCVMLFSCKRHEVFPTDVWIKRIVYKLYFNDKDVSLKEIWNFSNEKFGELAGFAQQYLFYYARENF